MQTVQAPETTANALLGEQPDEAALQAYERNGALIVRGLISPDWIEKLRDSYDHLAELAIDPSARGVPSRQARQVGIRFNMWEEEGCFRSFLFDSPIAQAAANAMRSRTAQLYEDMLITEPAGGVAQNSWHQDEPTWPVSGRMLSSIWLSLEPVRAETGAMRFVHGSHRGPLYRPPHVNPQDVGDDALRWTGGDFPKIDENPDATVIQTEADPGDAIIFHPGAIHCAYGSAKDRPRRTFTIRFLGDDVTWLPRNRMFHEWMRDLDLKKGDRVVTPRLPVVYDAMA